MILQNVTLRKERLDDYETIAYVIREAFWNVYQPGCVEHYIVERLRRSPAFIKELAYVAIYQGQIVGHIAYARSFIETPTGLHVATILFGPVAVLPEFQGRGIGSKLIQTTLTSAARLGHHLVCITGHPDYYHRFGFETASKYGIHMRNVPIEDSAPFFMVKALADIDLYSYQGLHIEPDVYETNQEEVDLYDARFPHKEKAVIPGQLR